MGRRILPVLFSLQGAHWLSFLPAFPSAAMQCQRWLQAQALAQSLTLPQSPGSGEKHENTWPLSHSCCSLPACSRREGRAGAARQDKGSFSSYAHSASAGQDEKKQKSKQQKPGSLSVSPVGFAGQKKSQSNTQNKQKKLISFAGLIPCSWEEPCFLGGSGESGACGVCSHHPELLRWVLAWNELIFRKEIRASHQAWIPLQWQALGHDSELIAYATVLASGFPGMSWKFTNHSQLWRQLSGSRLREAVRWTVCDLHRGMVYYTIWPEPALHLSDTGSHQRSFLNLGTRLESLLNADPGSLAQPLPW